MPTEHDNTTTASTTQPGPNVLEERTLSGIFVHLLGVGTGFILPALVYLVAEREFTRRNARNAFNWQVIVTGVFAALFGLLAAGFAIDSLASESSLLRYLGMAFVLVAAMGLFGSTLVVLVNVVFGLVAMGKAIFGTAWRYPLAPDVVGWLASRVRSDVGWWKLLAAHLVVTPLAGTYLAWLILEPGAEDSPMFFVGFGLVLALVLSSVLTPGVLVRDMRVVATTSTSWQPSWVTYLGGPAGIAALTYVAATVQFHSENPSGDAVYGFAGALWIAVSVYLYRRYRRVDSP
ncbi:DUF4870 domain-containing protein [Natronorubrum sp. JWXQ-INN-674]|uniref:DUF4870 domain-containing protein n=1 Tax=Natronorubrum halalkaliphilum TaxID=2691917 RepID=A0A6B0VK72_9EURY|nr:DUF4870 domain-containing protein [Natronorubrum halalkaliphilum]MXV61182.1 DUF4870 domain-containing protein [Natronorubrum halalkaliphilum]